MAGRPKLAAVYVKLDEYGEERLFSDLMTGLTLRDLCAALEISPQTFHLWLRRDDKRHAIYREMRKALADGLAEESLELIDGATNSSISVVRERVKVRQWLAERWNRADYGVQQGGTVVNVGIAAGELHLTAMKEVPQLPSKPQPLLEVGTDEGEVEVVA